MIQVLKKTWRQRLLSLLLPILLVFAMAGVGVKVPAQAAGNDAGAQAGEMKVHFLNVGQGLSILVQSEGKTMIYDGGDKKTSRFVVAYLKEQGVTEIDYLPRNLSPHTPEPSSVRNPRTLLSPIRDAPEPARHSLSLSLNCTSFLHFHVRHLR